MTTQDPVSSQNSRRLLRLKQAADYLSLSSWKLRQLVYNGAIPFVQPEEGSPYLFDRADLDRYVENNKHTL